MVYNQCVIQDVLSALADAYHCFACCLSIPTRLLLGTLQGSPVNANKQNCT